MNQKILNSCAFFLLIVLSTAHARASFEEPWGQDADLKTGKKYIIPVKKTVVGRMVDGVIWFHQKIISPVDGPRSHFRPTSSEYMRQAIHRHGFFTGFLMGCDRLMRENDDPWVYPVVMKQGVPFKWDPP